MKVYFALLLLSSCLLTSLIGQDMSPSIISPNGGIAKSSTMILEWTIGELAVETIRAGDKMYTEGFHQPTLKVEPIEQEVITNRSITGYTGSADLGLIRVAPNPVSGLLNIEFDLTEEMEIQIQLNEFSGKILKNDKIRTEKGSIQMDLTSFPAGTYVLQVKSNDGRFVRSCKISKI